MSGLGFNKVAGAALATALAVFGLHEVSGMVFETHAPKKPGYLVEVKEDEGSGPAAPEVPPDWGTVLAAADVAKGKDVFSKCTSCHKPTDENGTGPGLNGIVGRAVAAHGGFPYSDAMKAHVAQDPRWTDDALFTFLRKPGAYVPGTKMTFVGIKPAEDRINLIAYLRTLGASIPVPAPDPSRAAGAAAPAGAEGAAPAAPAAGPGEAGQAAPTAAGVSPATAATPMGKGQAPSGAVPGATQSAPVPVAAPAGHK